MPNGNYFPGLSYVNNRFIPPHTDTSEAFYIPSPDSPKDGACGSVNRAGTKAFTLVVDVDALKGITLCPVLFNYPTTSSLPPPTGNGGVAEIDQYKQTAGMTILHELVHLVSSNSETGLFSLPFSPQKTPPNPQIHRPKKKKSLIIIYTSHTPHTYIQTDRQPH